ncbi:MAG: CinA family nicotinamide mononucleotide deamidase-related protein [Rikenellaceae bacterium]|nr:CinA family nicotinamide mononucleotide deamidase-related protein [Rikenellaceae bacterium]
MLTAAICTIGDEILIGQIVDTNSSLIAKELNKCGIKVNKMISIQDDESEIVSTLEEISYLNDILIVTGGLGPTKDDITKRSLARLCKCNEYRYDELQATIIDELCRRRGIFLSQLNRDQALVPECCRVLPNRMGTAPGMIFTLSARNGKKVMLFSLPGVPYEMEHLLPSVIKTIKDEFVCENIFHRTLLTYGIPESILASKIESWEDNLPKEIKLAYLPSPQSGVKLRISIYGGDYTNYSLIVEDEVRKLRSLLGSALYGENDETLEAVVGRFLLNKGMKLSVAESCTSGMLSSLLTSIPGSSAYFTGGVVAYDNNIKRNILGVKEDTLQKYGAVSCECVREMAEGIKRIMGTDYSIATSGIAGPSGGTEAKPVGTICIAIAGPDFIETYVKVFNGDRVRNVQRFSAEALNLFRLKLGIQSM